MLSRTPVGGRREVRELSPIVTRSRAAQAVAAQQGAIPRNSHIAENQVEGQLEDELADGAAGGGETSAINLLNLNDFPTAFYSPEEDQPINQLRDMRIEQGAESHHSTQTMGETLTRLQLDLVRRSADEMNKMRQTFKEEMEAAMREMQIRLRQTMLAPHTEPRRENNARENEPPPQAVPEWRERSGNNSRAYSDTGNGRHREKKLDIHKWGIKFEGETGKMSVEDFIFRVEHLKNYHGITWEELIGDFHKLLGYKASEWYWIQVRMNGVPDWSTLRSALRRTYSPRLTNFELERELMERIQRPGETIDDYIHEMSRLRAQLRTPISEAEMVRVLKRNIKESLGRILFPMNIQTVERLRAEYHAAEKAFSNRNAYRTNQPLNQFRTSGRAHVSEVASTWPEEQPDQDKFEHEIEEAYGENVTCWNCREIGHNYISCPRPRTIFCYKCGKANVITPKCPKCRPGNQRRSPIMASMSCSTQTENLL